MTRSGRQSDAQRPVFGAREPRANAIELVGKQLLMTRGALTTFSIANDVATYFVKLLGEK